MIIRRSFLGHGKSPSDTFYTSVFNIISVGRLIFSPARNWCRSFATEIDTLEASIENSLKETHSIESLLQQGNTEYLPKIDDETHRTFNLNHDATVQKFDAIKHQSMVVISSRVSPLLT